MLAVTFAMAKGCRLFSLAIDQEQQTSQQASAPNTRVPVVW